MTVDAVIVGSGPGGATVADVLTAAGWSVVIVEKGRNHLLDPDDLTRPATDYSNDELKFIYRHFLGPDPLIEPRTFRAARRTASTPMSARSTPSPPPWAGAAPTRTARCRAFGRRTSPC